MSSVKSEVLYQLKRRGVESAVLAARIAYMDAEGIGRYARAMVDQERVYPDILPTAQASGRFSTTKPPLVNFPANKGYSVAWGMLLPDPGTWWAHFDFDALHARIACCYTHDQGDLDAFAHGWDIHTKTACDIWKWEFVPPDGVDGCSDWAGKEDRRRRLAKVMRYALLLGLNENAALESQEVWELGLSRKEVLAFARLYLKAKPQTVAGKRLIFEQVAKDCKARSFGGRLRRLYGDAKTRAKDGWSHILQGGEQDIIQTVQADLFETYPDAALILNSHDGLTWAMPDHLLTQEVVSDLHRLVEREWEINGQRVFIPASWEFHFPSGEGGTIKAHTPF